MSDENKPIEGQKITPGLIAERDVGPEEGSFSTEFQQALADTEAAALKLKRGDSETWSKARQIVEQFRPVPWFIWRLAQFVLGRPEHTGKISESMTLGLRRLLFAAASDPFIGTGEKVNTVRKALTILPSDVVAAVSVIHSIARRLSSHGFDRIWKPILEDAIIRAQIGFLVGHSHPTFGAGRGMLAGFSGRSGLAVLIATGTAEQAQEALEALSTGSVISAVGTKVYGAEPLQVSAMMLSAVGCGSDSAFGISSFIEHGELDLSQVSGSRRTWLAAFTACEFLRSKRGDEISAEIWDELQIADSDAQSQLTLESIKLGRRGHTLTWLE